MRLLFVNPNTTAEMTETVRRAAAAVAPPHVRLDAMTSPRGPAAIQGPEDGEAAIPGLLEAIDTGLADGSDAVVVACFDDTGLEAARARAAPRPVIGIGQAAFHAAMLLGGRFSVVTTLAVSVPVIEENLARYGLGRACARVRASGVAVLELERDRERASERVSDEIARAVAEDGVDAVVLGCAGMAPLVAPMSARHGVTVIDGVQAACGLAAALLALRGEAARPPRRSSDGH